MALSETTSAVKAQVKAVRTVAAVAVVKKVAKTVVVAMVKAARIVVVAMAIAVATAEAIKPVQRTAAISQQLRPPPPARIKSRSER